MRKSIYIILTVCLSSCGIFQKKQDPIKAASLDSSALSNIGVAPDSEMPGKKFELPLVSHPTVEKKWGLIHTQLNLSFNYKLKQVNGSATLSLKPWFYNQTFLRLDAKSMEILSVEWLNKKCGYTFQMDSVGLSVFFDAPVTDTVYIKIAYIAKPYLKKSHGSSAISEDRGIYFINPDSSENNKPTEIWTQGETEAASCWFPTLDAPNQKMTQEINLTVDKNFKTLSNGKLIKTIQHTNGTKTDCWAQYKPHAPYLAMAAVGPWSIYHDKWRDSVAVDYYMEPEYFQYAKLIFGNTPSMLELFSRRLGVAYPWDKFSQVVVRDFVSGAMENTSAVVHGEFLNHDARQHLDNSFEDVISHELFHHWFGDLVTCESWSNLPLNESFATYGEYLWREFKYGKDDAEYHRLGFLKRYLSEADNKQEPLIRYIYRDKEDMFDAHSYQKGGLVLYALREQVGDSAFYKSLELYLKRNANKTAEIHDLRMAFEEVTGQDLNWFFNQFFLTAGHPELSVEKSYDEINKKLILTLTQSSGQNYSFPINIEIWNHGEPTSHRIHIGPDNEVFEFAADTVPDFVLVDPGKNWLCQMKQNNTAKQWKKQFDDCARFMDQYEALSNLRLYINADNENRQYVLDATTNALSSNKKGIVLEAIDMIEEIEEQSLLSKIYKDKLIDLALHHQDAVVRNKSIVLLNKLNDPSIRYIYDLAINDSSYTVMSNALDGLLKYDTLKAVNFAQQCINSNNILLKIAGLSVSAEHGQENYTELFSSLLSKVSMNVRMTVIYYMGVYLARIKNIEEANRMIALFTQENKRTGAPWYYTYTIRGNLEAAMQSQTDLTIKSKIVEAINSLPPSGSMRIEFK